MQDGETVGVVTALHGVADCEEIKAKNDNIVSVDALEIIKVDIDRDVALLGGEQLDDLTIEGLVIETSVEGLLDEDLVVVGYPVNLGTQRPTDLKYLGLKKLRELIPEDTGILTSLDRRNSPNLNFKMLDLQGHLLPGHSGAPILNQANKLIGVGNGGLNSGTIEIGWAVPWQEIEWKPIAEDSEVAARFENLQESNPSLFSFTTSRNRIILEPKVACQSAIGYDSLDELKEDLLNRVKQAAADEFLSGDYEGIEPDIRSQVRTLATKYVRISGSEQYYNDSAHLASLCVSIAPYISTEDHIQAIERTERACVPAIASYEQLPIDAEEKAIIQALESYNRGLKRLDKDEKLQLMRQQTEARIDREEAQVCATITGKILPLEVIVRLNTNSTEGGRIAFYSNRDGNFEIYTMNADGSDPIRLTHNEASDEFASWSPDGSRITFHSNRDGNFEIYTMNTDGTNLTRLTHNESADRFASWSPDGSRIAFQSSRDGNWEIYVMNIDGSNPTRLTNSEGFNWPPSWSPDGSRITFSRGLLPQEVYVMNADGSDLTILTNNESVIGIISPSWSPDGSRIAFMAISDNNWGIHVMSDDGSDLTFVIPIELAISQSIPIPSWSPDGSRIAFDSDSDGNSEIYVMNVDGSNLTRLTHNEAEDYVSDWKP